MPSISSITPSPGTIARSAATISARRARIPGSRAGICIPGLSHEKAAEAEGPAARGRSRRPGLALAGLEARVGLVDDVDAALAAHDTGVLVAQLHGLEGMADLPGSSQQKRRRGRGNSERARKIGT